MKIQPAVARQHERDEEREKEEQQEEMFAKKKRSSESNFVCKYPRLARRKFAGCWAPVFRDDRRGSRKIAVSIVSKADVCRRDFGCLFRSGKREGTSLATEIANICAPREKPERTLFLTRSTNRSFEYCRPSAVLRLESVKFRGFQRDFESTEFADNNN